MEMKHYVEEFVRESWWIERETCVVDEMVEKHLKLLEEPRLTVDIVKQFCYETTGGMLRTHLLQSVSVGDYTPPRGCLEMPIYLSDLLLKFNDAVNAEKVDYNLPWKLHMEFESLHPFTDGNGRTGRALWLWHKCRIHGTPQFTFLHEFYYDTLRGVRQIRREHNIEIY